MKRKFSAFMSLALVLGLCFSLAACGSQETAANNDNSSAGTTVSTNDTDSQTEQESEYTETYELIFTNHDSTTSVGELYCETILQEISDACGGRITYQFNPGGSLFGATEAVEAVRSGLADICWNSASSTIGVFPVSEFLNVPLQGINCAQLGSKVLMDMYETMPEVAAEWEDFYVIELQACGEAPFSFATEKLEDASDFSGLVIRTAGTAQSAYITALGASASSMPTSEVYEAMSKGVVKAMTNDWHNIDCFSLYETISYVMDFPINVTCCWLIMNKDVYNSLDAEVQAAFESYRNYASDMAGYYWDSMRFVAGDKVEAQGAEIYTPSDELYAYLTSDELTEQMKQWYIDYIEGFGYDGEDIYNRCKAIVDSYGDTYADVYSADNPFYYSDWMGYEAWLELNG
ncbi:MAG: TRAP transporter substrate-binding protein DctP [Oscillospiraceae bacterium]|nr:TRAP transporter substrate-binding protein DctP [Oscillospiraceae bacterium]